MDNENKNSMKDYILAAISFFAVAGIVFVAYYAITGGFSHKDVATKVENKKSSSGLTSRQILKKFIVADGNIGDIAKVQYDKVFDGTEKDNMLKNRTTSNATAKKYIAVNSAYMEDASDGDVFDYSDSIVNPEYFTIDPKSVLLTEATPIDEVKVQNKNGTSKLYEAVSIKASFTSTAYQVMKTADDTSWDMSYLVRKSQKRYNNVKFTMIKQLGEWRVYDFTQKDSISTRFATFQPDVQKQQIIDYKDSVKIGKGGDFSGAK